MNRRADFCRRIAVIALVLAVISLGITAGRTARAQDEELTLAGLAEQLVSLVSRVDAIETGLEEMTPGLGARVEAIESIFANPWSPEVVRNNDGICQSPLHVADSLFLRGEVRQETADAYRAAYGVSINPSDVYLMGLAFAEEGSRVYLTYAKDRRIVVEEWENCEFLGHSEWEDQ